MGDEQNPDGVEGAADGPAPSADGTADPAHEVSIAPWLLVLAIAAPAVVVFVLPMIGLIGRNAEYFAGDLTVGRMVYLAGAVTALIGIGLWAARHTAAGRVGLTCYLLATPAFVVYTLLGELTRSIVLLVVAVVVIAAAVAIERLGRTRWLSAFAVVSAVILAADAVSTTIESSTSIAREAVDDAEDVDASAPEIPNRPDGSGLPNVYHVILDEMQTDQFDLALDDDAREDLRGFTAFPDAVTTYGRTEMALADMFDAEGYDYSTPAAPFTGHALVDPSSSLQQLRAAGYRTTGFIPSRSLWGKTEAFDETVLAADLATSDPGDDYSDLASSLWVDATMPDTVTKRLVPARHYEQLSTKALIPDDQPAIAVQAFRAFINRERQQPATGRYTVLHVIIPHKPYVLGPDCEYVPGVDTSAVDQAGCALHLVDDLLDELDELGRLESSTVVIQGDHGAGLIRTGDELRAAPTEYFDVEWSSGRSRPLILVKPAGTGRTAPLAISDRPALTTDVMPTIFDSVDLTFEGSDERVSLLAADFPERPERYYHFYEKGMQGLPDTQVVRFVVTDDGLAKDEIVPIPPPN